MKEKVEYHPRAEAQYFDKTFRAHYERYDSMSVMQGPSSKNMQRGARIRGSSDYWIVRDQLGKDLIALVPVAMPSFDERFLWVDLTYPLRGIYIPKSHLAHPKYTHMCTYSRLDFRLRETTLKTYTELIKQITFLRPVFDILRRTTGLKTRTVRWVDAQRREQTGVPEPGLSPNEEQWLEKQYRAEEEEDGLEKGESQPRFAEGKLRLPNNHTTGWGFQPLWTAQFDIFTLASILAMSDHLLKPDYKDPYQFITLFSRGAVRGEQTVFPDPVMDYDKVIDFARMFSVQLGTELTYKGNGLDPNWLVRVMSGILAVGLSCIPIVGPLVVLGEQLIVDAILDPSSFESQEGLISKIPGFGAAFVGSIQNIKSFSHKDGGNATRALALEKEKRRMIPVNTGEDESKEEEAIVQVPWTETDLSNLSAAPDVEGNVFTVE